MEKKKDNVSMLVLGIAFSYTHDKKKLYPLSLQS